MTVVHINMAYDEGNGICVPFFYLKEIKYIKLITLYNGLYRMIKTERAGQEKCKKCIDFL